MASTTTFNAVVAARTRTAQYIRNDSELLATYKKYGGLEADLESIEESGERAELLSQMRGSVEAGGTAATLALLQKFAGAQRNYVEVMAVLQAVVHDMQSDGATAEQIAPVQKVLANETPVVIRTVQKSDGEKKKIAVKSKGQEALRAEIQKDATALLEMKDVLKLLAKRGITAARIKALQADAADLSGKLADRAAAKGASKGATSEVRQAVQDQKKVWAACYRILALVGQADQRVHSLLAEASATG